MRARFGNILLHTTYQRKADVDMLNAIKSVLADVSSITALRQSKEEIMG